MNNSLPKHLMLTTLLVCGAAALAHGNNTTNAPAAARPLSLFVDDPTRGKDPFFPDSTRRGAPALAQTTPSNAAPTTAWAANNLSLKAISGSKLQPLALINNATISVGEAAEIRAGGKPLRIRCREIRDRSVVIEIDGTGELRELKLREGI